MRAALLSTAPERPIRDLRKGSEHVNCPFMQSLPSLPRDPGLLFMVLCACTGIIGLTGGCIYSAVSRRWAEFRAMGAPLLALSLTLAMGRTLQGYHLPIMASIVALAGWSITRTRGRARWFASVGTAGMACAIITAVLLF